MKKLPNNLFNIYKKNDNKNIYLAHEISKLNISNDWQETLLDLCYSRGIKSLNERRKERLTNIGQVNSRAIYQLSQFGKKVGLETLEYLSIEINSEELRKKAVSIILEKGVKPSKNELACIVSEAKHQKNLFDM